MPLTRTLCVAYLFLQHSARHWPTTSRCHRTIIMRYFFRQPQLSSLMTSFCAVYWMLPFFSVNKGHIWVIYSPTFLMCSTVAPMLQYKTVCQHQNDNKWNKTSLRSASYVSRKRGTARICCCAPCSNPPISFTRRAHSSKPAARCCSGRTGQTDGRTLYRYIDHAPLTLWAVPLQ